MDNTETFDVVCSGKIKPGYDLLQVQENFAELLKISVDKAKSIVGTKRVLKKDLDASKADLYKRKLEDIGLVVALKSNGAPATKSGLTLALEPTEEELQAQQQNEMLKRSNTTQNFTAQDTSAFACPKCGQAQEKSAECQGCGIIFSKYRAAQETNGSEASASSGQLNQATSSAEPVAESINVIGIIAATFVAVLGAIAWFVIAVFFGYEYSLVAVLIGSGVGFAAYTFGGRGQVSGIICAVLTLFSIFAGKYFSYTTFDLAAMGIVYMQSEEFQEGFAEQAEIARLYVEQVHDEDSVRQFMIDYEMTEASSVSAISSEEISEWQEFVDPWYRGMVDGGEDLSAVLAASLGEGMEQISTFEMMKEDFGIIDILFLVFGLGAAYRLGSGLNKET